MNIFALDTDPIQAAKWHCDAHVIKMTLETAQMLSTINRLAGKTDLLYRVTHINHPCTVWARETSENYFWLYRLGIALGSEYKERYGKTHASMKIIESLSELPSIVPSGNLTGFALCMPDQYKRSNPVLSYRVFYRIEKNQGRLGTWKQNKPEWWK
jgi:hypothetical protein